MDPVRAPIPTDVRTLAHDEPSSGFDPARARGAIFGAALGAALAAGPGGAALAADTIVLAMQTLGAFFNAETDDPARDLAERAARWHRDAPPGGTRETVGAGACNVVGRVVARARFAEDPVAAARGLEGPKATNGALLRAVACAFTVAPADWAIALCEATHADERCAATACMLALLLNALGHWAADAAPTPGLAAGPVAAGRALIAAPPRRADYMRRLTDTARLEGLKLGDDPAGGEPGHQTYAVKTCAVAMWAFRQLVATPVAEQGPAFFEATVCAVAARGGDATTNAAVAGAVLGAALGSAGLPQGRLAALPRREWLSAEVERFLSAAAPTWAAP
jgi:ADP-ribosylglycohydrolase